jgi:hypothetical protein
MLRLITHCCAEDERWRRGPGPVELDERLARGVVCPQHPKLAEEIRHLPHLHA